MSAKSEVLYAVGVLNDSMRDVEQAVLGMEEAYSRHERQLDLLLGQGQSVTKSLGELVAAVGMLTKTINDYIDEQGSDGSLGARVTRLEGRLNARE